MVLSDVAHSMVRLLVTFTLVQLVFSSPSTALQQTAHSVSDKTQLSVRHRKLTSSISSSGASFVVNSKASGYQVVTADFDDDDGDEDGHDEATYNDALVAEQQSSTTATNASSTEECNLQQTDMNM